MTTEHKGRTKISRKTIISIIIVVAVILIAFGAGILLYWLNRGGGPNDDSGLIGLPDRSGSKEAIQAQDLAAQGKYDQAQQVLSDALKNTSDNTEKYNLYLEQGVNFESQRKYDEAIAAYQQAAAAQATSGVYEAIARAATSKGDKQLAIQSYQKAIEQLNLTDERQKSMKADYENQIKELSK